MTTRVKQADIEGIALAAVLPVDATDVVLLAEVTPGGQLPNGTPNGVGGRTQYGPAWLIGGRTKSAPVALFDDWRDARSLAGMLAGPEGELWHIKERRRARIAELEAAEAASAIEARATAKENGRLARKGVDLRDALGGGSSRRERSREKRSDTTRMRVEETLRRSQPA